MTQNDHDRAIEETQAGGPAPAGDQTPAWSEGDAALHLEDLVGDASASGTSTQTGGLAIELIGPHLRVAGSIQIGQHRRLSDFVNHHAGLIELHDATVLRRNGDPTRVHAPNIWINFDDVTLVGAVSEDRPQDSPSGFVLPKVPHAIIAVTPGHTLTGEVHLAREAMLAAFIESNDPAFIPMTDVRTRSLADRRVMSRYPFVLLNRRHIVAATALQPGMIRGRSGI